ncbi:hypothetical protein TURU_021912 [Turdus rufiventris]|nr:hypothetical protein TURU_021912 [Turdus rufiventris]
MERSSCPAVKVWDGDGGEKEGQDWGSPQSNPEKEPGTILEKTGRRSLGITLEEKREGTWGQSWKKQEKEPGNDLGGKERRNMGTILEKPREGTWESP